MEFSKNYGQIIIGYGLLSIGITLVMLFLQTAGILWLVFASVTIVVAIWIIKRERNARKKMILIMIVHFKIINQNDFFKN
tara:strand:+ start:1063 stop:1302 length:240 start_codon:yes stop_codon:yes gene_type:complete